LIAEAFGIDPIDMDGPDFFESSEVAPENYFQYELGFGKTVTQKILRNQVLMKLPY